MLTTFGVSKIKPSPINAPKFSEFRFPTSGGEKAPLFPLWKTSIKTLASINIVIAVGNEERLESIHETAIYRIVQELVNNVIKHSKANKGSIDLHRQEQDIFIKVQDNGNGFKLENIKNDSMGIRNIKNRVKLLNGDMNIDATNKGTIVKIKLML